MLRKIGTLIGYTKAPKATFMLKHPVKGAVAYTAYHNLSRTQTAGLAAAALAVPVGAWFLLRH